ncbi:OmpA family protein [Filimonas effusa]|uniref:Flagellar motor protein MotB n=1 Tax=Filimonas effusa TaxID=2508721 RepID=A0A4Q1D3I2_9BACT|nr:OmpA family protein [Filimonas effusa]RXK82935.1 flagellar motor protein MotB [Filimonas effusa]
MKKLYIIAGIFCITATAAKSQFVYDYLKAGDNYFASADYASAANYYEKYLGNSSKTDKEEYAPYKPQSIEKKKLSVKSGREKALWQLAESYRQLNYPSKAAAAYQQLLSINTTDYPLLQFHLAAQLRALEKYAEAEAAFSAFLTSYTREDNYKKAAEREIANLKFIQKELAKPGLQYFEVIKGQGAMSSTGANYAPVWLDSATLMFTSTRPVDSLKKSSFSNQLFLLQYSQGAVAPAVTTELKAARGMEQGAASVSADGNTIYLTRWKAAGNKEAMILKAVKQDGKWSDPKPLPAIINTAGYSAQQPFVTSDNKYLFFSSNKPGGHGGFDIWYIAIDQLEKEQEPLNAGNIINSAGDEQAPYYDTDSSRLFFASNGRVGMGGFDLFSAGGEAGSFNSPVNLGYPINSVKDDIYYAKRTGAGAASSEIWLSSDRSAACCLELFRIVQHKPAPVITPQPVKEEPVVIQPVVDTTHAEVLENVYYAYDKAQLLDGSERSLDKLVAMLNANKEMIIEIGGHTDSKGSEVYNERLSLARAQSCVNYIVSKGISPERIKAQGYGASKPIAPNNNPDGSDNPDGRKLNRRTEFRILKY